MTDPCPHCLPAIRRHTFIDRFGDWMYESAWKIAGAMPWKTLKFFEDILIDRLMDACVAIGIAKLEENPDETKFHNRSLLCFHEARRRGMDVRAVKLCGTYPRSFCLSREGKRTYFDDVPLTLGSTVLDVDDKRAVKRFLSAHGMPVTEGESFKDVDAAFEFGRTFGFPLAVKPHDGSLSKHATYPVQDEITLREAIAIAKAYRSQVIVERFVDGALYRATVVGRDRVFICRKDPANVIGNGVSTVRELVERKNQDARRSDARARNTTLHKIPMDRGFDEQLAAQSLTRASVPSAGAFVGLQRKATLSAGCDIVACTSDVHSDNLALFRRIAALLDTELIGIDFICPDVTISYTKQPCAVIELNSLPYIDMHANPSHGEPDPIAAAIWDLAS